MMSIGLDAPLLLGNNKVTAVLRLSVPMCIVLVLKMPSTVCSTAIGLFQSVVNIIILLAADKFAKAIGEDGII